ncbi:hypothetical protein D9M73_294190 [compost metagenome]
MEPSIPPEQLSVAALALDIAQAIALETEELVHAVAGAVDPFLDQHFIALAVLVDHFPIA